MELSEIRKLLQDGEGLTVEFKKNTHELNNSVFETISSFSNRYGGHIFLGVNDDGTILGVNPHSVHGMKMNFANLLNNPLKVSPPMYLALEEIKIDDKLILYTYVPEGSQIQSVNNGKIYDRNEDGDFEITRSTELIEGDVFKTIVPLPKLDENLEGYDGNRVVNDGNIDGNVDNIECNDGNSEGNLVPHPSYTLLSLLRDNPTATYAELAINLGISEATVTRRIKKLKEAKKIERIGSTHGKWVVTEN